MKTAPKVEKVSVLVFEKLVLTGSDTYRHQIGSKSVLVVNSTAIDYMLIMSPVYLKVNGYKLIKNCAKIDISRIAT